MKKSRLLSSLMLFVQSCLFGSAVVEANTLFLNPGPTYLSFSDSPFNGLVSDYFHLEDFEDGLLNTLGVSALGGGGVNSPNQLTDSVDADDGVIDGSGRDGYDYGVGSSNNNFATFIFDINSLGNLPTHAGIVWTDVGNTGDPPTTTYKGDVTFEAFDENGFSLGTIFQTDVGDGVSVRGQTAEDRFFGVIYSGGISKITISMNSTDWAMDHLQYGHSIVPIPPSVWLFGSGLLGMIAIARRKKSA